MKLGRGLEETLNNFFLSSISLLQREVIRFLRQPHRIIGALGTPLVFWFLIGSGLGKSFRSPSLLTTGGGSVNYLQYFFPGTIVMILLFTAIFSTISIIEDRREGFLQGVLVSPAPRSAIVMGKILGGTLLATVQGLLFVICAPLLGIHMSLIEIVYVVSMMLIVSFGLTGLGFLIAWRLDSTQGFHAIMNLFLMPMWFLSGSLFPMAGAPMWLQFIMRINPLTYGVAALHQSFFHGSSNSTSHMPSASACLIISLLFGVAMFFSSVYMAQKVESPAQK